MRGSKHLKLTYFLYYFQSSLETVLTPLTQKFFNWGAVENSACYIAIGVAALSGYFVLMLVQKFLKTEDRTLLLSGCVGVTISMSTAIFTWPLGYYGANWLLPVFAAQIGMGVFFLESLTHNWKFQVGTLLIRAITIITEPYLMICTIHSV